MLPAKILLTASALTVSVATVAADRFDADFDNELGNWSVVVDGVMGGRSTGRVARNEPGVMEFSGDLSLENNGGFSQIRCDVPADRFAGMRGIEIKVRGDGRAYNFDIRCSHARVMAGSFQSGFRTEEGEWTTVRLPFDEFRLYTFGRRVPGAPAVVPTKIESIGITLSDKEPGPFRLDVASIRAFGDESEAGPATTSDLATLSRTSALETLQKLVDSDKRAIETVSATASAEAVRLTELAIDRAVPLFNAGQTAACAAIYEVTIEAMVALGADDLGETVIDRLKKGLAEAKTDHDPAERAWTYRRTLDEAYVQLARQAGRTGRGPGVASR